MIYIDFETRSECDLKRAGAWKYSLHPSTEVLGYADAVDNSEVESTFLEIIEIKEQKEVDPLVSLLFQLPEWARKIEKTVAIETDDSALYSPPDFISLITDHGIEAHNAGFEFAIWHNIMMPRYGWPEVPPDRWYCSAAKAAAYGLPRSLEGAAAAMGLPVQKDMAGRALMLKLCKPRPMWKKKGTGDKYFGTLEEFERLEAYCRQDVETEYALSQALEALSPLEDKIWRLDQTINRRGVFCDLGLVNRAIEVAKAEEQRGKAEISRLTNGEVASPNQVAKLKEYLNKIYSLHLTDLTADTVDQELIQCEKVKTGKRNIAIKSLLQLRQRHSKSSVKKFLAMRDRACDDGRIRETLLYHGAHTGRWTGVGIQPHNYPRPQFNRATVEGIIIPAVLDGDVDSLNFYCGSVSGALSSMLRSALYAAPGHELIGADYSSIEARVLLWLADDQKALAKIRAGVDLYVDMAATIYGKDPLAVTKAERALGKVAVLGLGYQMGPSKFHKTCESWGIPIDVVFAERVVDTYRAKYSTVVKLWRKLEFAAKSALKYSPNKWYEHQPPFLFLKLPSGRRMAYKDPKIEPGPYQNESLTYMRVDPVSRKWVRAHTYGGMLVENMVQATSRDIMAEGMLRAEAAGYPVVMSVHDEVVAEVPSGFGNVDEFVNLLCRGSDWADGCPIAAEGWRGKRYRK